MAKLLDANAILRYLLLDNEEQARAVREAVERGAETVPEVLCECVYVLQGKVYGFSRPEISRALSALLEDVECERGASMLRALEVYASTRLDFVDCILAAMAEVEGRDVLTFDRKLARLLPEG